MITDTEYIKEINKSNVSLMSKINRIERQYAEIITIYIKECEQLTGRPFNESLHADKVFAYLDE